MHFNIQRLAKTITDLEGYFDILNSTCCFSEHWLLGNKITQLGINNLSLVNSFWKKQLYEAVLVGNQKYSTTHQNFKNQPEKQFEYLIYSRNLNYKKTILYIVSFYWTTIKYFFASMDKVLHDIYEFNLYYIICGDISNDLLIDSANSKTIFDLFAEFGL